MALKRNIPQKVVVMPKDVMIILGRSHRTACTVLQNLRKKLGKEKYQYITITEFCQYAGIAEELVKDLLVD